MLDQTGCAGVMIGRGAFAMPWIFRLAWKAQFDEHTTSPDLKGEPTEPEKIEIVRRYYERMCEHRNETAALHRLRNKISWLGKGINGSHCRPLKEAIRTAATRREVHAALDAWLAKPDAAAGTGSGTTPALAD